MSKLPIAGVAVTVLFNVVIAVVPTLTEEQKKAIFVYAIPLFIVACIWWALEFFRTHKTKPELPQASVTARDITNSAVATAARDVHQNIYQSPSNPLATDGPNPRIQALEDLKKLLREGDKMVQDFYLGNWESHSEKSIDDFDARARACAQRGALDVSGQDWSLFDEPWEINDTIKKAAALCDAGLLPNLIIDPFASNLFGKLYGRVERLRELLTALTGFKIESPYVSGGPVSYTPNAPDIRKRANNLLVTVASRIRKLAESVDSASGALESIATFPQEFRYKATKQSNFPKLFEIDKDSIIEEALRIYKETECPAFHDLWQDCISLNNDIEDYNTLATAALKERIRYWTKQKIPSEIAKAQIETIKRH